MYIQRLIFEQIKKRILQSPKVVIIYGARQVGKTTLVNKLVNDISLKTLRIDAEDSRYTEVLSSKNIDHLKSLLAGYQLVVIDEAQQIPEIGTTLKLIHDHIPDVKVIATGSSSFDLSNKVVEPLTGRHWSYTLYPISYGELALDHNAFELDQKLENNLVYGSYPEIISIASLEEKKEYLNHLASAYLFKDILQLVQVRNSLKLQQLLKMLAYQIGSQVSLNEIGAKLDMNRDTVIRYVDLLEKSFVIFRLGGLSRNLRNEVTKMDKIYFYDLGIRNSVIDMLKPFGDRNDIGQLWENFLIIERMKHNAYSNIQTSNYFWRLSTGAEIDFVEEKEGKYDGYEFKWADKQAKPPASWLAGYPGASYATINRSNYLPFITNP
ncbi:MAG: ATP-binding protein [Anaerolineales bacterium]|nr:ATP-binding protein [Anaerolineales bacterium]